MRRSVLASLACGLALAGVIALSGYWYNRPTVLKIAVTRESEDAQLIAAIAQNFSKDHDSIRLRPVMVNDATAAAAALETEQADLSVIRTDVRIPINGQTLVILHHNPAILITTPTTRITQIADLRGRAVGVVHGPTSSTGNMHLFESILAQYELSARDVQMIDLAREDVFDAISTGKVSAVMVVGALTSTAIRDTVVAVTQAGKAEPVFVPITEAKAMALRSPVFESIDVVRGAFGGTPPKPANAFESLGVSVRLMASSAMHDGVAAEITRQLFANRPAIALVAPIANQMEAPSTARSAVIPVHPGAAAFLDDEEKSFFDTYSDAIYIGAMVLSVLGSAAAALASRIGGNNVAEADSLLHRLLDVLRMARVAETTEALDGLEHETDEILINGVASRRTNSLDANAIGALGLALDQARQAIKDRRRALAANSEPAPNATIRALPRDPRTFGGKG